MTTTDDVEVIERERCDHCRGTGLVLTTNDLLRESLALLGDSGDAVVRDFYTLLFEKAPHLAGLFPTDLLAEDTISGQRDKLLEALTALAQTYDPGNSSRMEILDRHLEVFGRSHANFTYRGGMPHGPATLDEYQAVKVVLFSTLHTAAGAAWRPEYDAAWAEAYDYAASAMLYHGLRAGVKAERYVRT